jgi:UDP-glucose 6-dehydrogenase
MLIYKPGLRIWWPPYPGQWLSFTTNLKGLVTGTDAVFVAIGTPSRR